MTSPDRIERLIIAYRRSTMLKDPPAEDVALMQSMTPEEKEAVDAWEESIDQFFKNLARGIYLVR